eukprot:TRINITY_DN66262_c0_g1_i1.p1 TRINITY_DN66262_c0_g1~~TRINITY_DN66262_c0_g1_i1.p1  ORF type:complete len:191 (-),score=30.76 TRINITY_DN66262_c0_g1_i1:80-652(-)
MGDEQKDDIALVQQKLQEAIEFVSKAEAAVDKLRKKDFPELNSFRKPPASVDTALAACMHLQAGINPDLEVDGRGRLKDSSWRAALRILNFPEKFVCSLRSFKDEINQGNVPQQNVDAAKQIAAAMGSDFQPDVLRKRSNLAAVVCDWVANIIMYYECCKVGEALKKQLQSERQAAPEATESSNAAHEES